MIFFRIARRILCIILLSLVFIKPIIAQRIPASGPIDAEIFGVSPSSADNSPAIQRACEYIIARPGLYKKLIIHSGRYVCREPIFLSRFASGIYVPFSIDIEGESNFSDADGYGTALDFSSCKDCFAIGVQGGKGVSISHLKLIGPWNYQFKDAYTFYNSSLKDIPDNGCQNTGYAPNAAIVIEPVGPKKPAVVYHGLDSAYRGGRNGSTGIQIHDIFMSGWILGMITSPNGNTDNADLIHAWNIQIQNVKIGFAGCQAEEKMNEIDHVEAWGVTHTVFATGIYGQGNIGNWHLHHFNIAGYVNTFAYNVQSGYFPSYYDHIYAETLGSLGNISSANGTSFSESSINFANYIDASMSYTYGQIQGNGVAYRDCQFRMYGTFNPITINNLNGYNSFTNCAFDAVPYFNSDYPVGSMTFTDCKIGGVLTASPQAVIVPIDSTAPGFHRTYPIRVSEKRQATIECSSNELRRVKVGAVIVAHNKKYIQQGVAGVVTAVGKNNFTISYVPKQIVTGNEYYLSIWQQKK